MLLNSESAFFELNYCSLLFCPEIFSRFLFYSICALLTFGSMIYYQQQLINQIEYCIMDYKLQLHNKRDNLRIQIRKEHNFSIFKSKRAMFQIQQSNNSTTKFHGIIQLYKSSLKYNLLKPELQNDLLLTIQNNWQSSNQNYMVAILSNILLDDIQISYVQQIFNIAADKISGQVSNELQISILAFFINCLFRKFEVFDQDKMCKLQQKFLPIIFKLLYSQINSNNDKTKIIEFDLLESIYNMFSRVDNDIYFYYRILRNKDTINSLLQYHNQLILLQNLQKIQSENLCLKIYGVITTVKLNINQILSKINPIISIINFYVINKQIYVKQQQRQNQQRTLIVDILCNIFEQKCSQFTLLKNESFKENLLKILLVQPEKYINCIFKLLENYIQQIQEPQLLSIISALKNNLELEGKDNIINISLRSLYQIFMYTKTKNRQFLHINQFRNIGGQRILEQLLQNKNQNIHRIICQIYKELDTTYEFN